eukprot:CAMPEP_0202713226 /NCGR_PEP_ID=MMETSP1385-20130828/52138_1 /ASSEMBLY_ACC=CAM_ASM_000861 /TAXON_ID=933848 /ORGANISM="Elphidium margaritaceum" /LENGTH=66 /DNA_ID=CAMNT_0049373513 /DNA_START=245 /DNA_END=445 /DNA_ORIENTATION=+
MTVYARVPKQPGKKKKSKFPFGKKSSAMMFDESDNEMAMDAFDAATQDAFLRGFKNGFRTAIQQEY